MLHLLDDGYVIIVENTYLFILNRKKYFSITMFFYVHKYKILNSVKGQTQKV